jgi:hypothetical protein
MRECFGVTEPNHIFLSDSGGRRAVDLLARRDAGIPEEKPRRGK